MYSKNSQKSGRNLQKILPFGDVNCRIAVEQKKRKYYIRIYTWRATERRTQSLVVNDLEQAEKGNFTMQVINADPHLD